MAQQYRRAVQSHGSSTVRRYTASTMHRSRFAWQQATTCYSTINAARPLPSTHRSPTASTLFHQVCCNMWLFVGRLWRCYSSQPSAMHSKLAVLLPCTTPFLLLSALITLHSNTMVAAVAFV